MKKMRLIIPGLIILAVTLIVARNINKNDVEESETVNKDNYIDNTGLVPVDTSGKEVKMRRSLGLDSNETACLAYEPTIENYINKADIIVKGETTDIKYFDCEGIPWSRLSVIVQDVISGDIENNTEIAVYVMEGFQYNGMDKNSLVEVEGDSLGLHKIGDTSVFVLNWQDGSDIFEKGSYLRTFGCYSEYRYIENEKKYNIYDTRIGGKLDEIKLEKKIKTLAGRDKQ
ncbi:MAG: hypothetical protein HFH68_02005 [Lachnospiraceae bacterium]|nr:hypothetical protein [Lachnospiraceae bacterium]